MKYPLITLLISLGLAMPLLHAQTDTLTTTYQTVNDTFNPPRFEDARSYVFMEGVETKRLLKVGLFNPHNNANIPGAFALNLDVSAFNLDLEQKLSPAFSLNTSLGLSFETGLALSFGEGWPVRFDPDAFRFNRISFTLNPRYYLGMRGRIAAGEQANNLSGNYLGLTASYFGLRGLEDDYDPEVFATWFSDGVLPNQGGAEIGLHFGMQRRVFNWSYFDLQVGISGIYSETFDFTEGPDGRPRPEASEGWRPALRANITYGIAIGSGDMEGGRACDVLLCFLEESRQFKVDLARAIPNVGRNLGNDGDTYVSTGLAIAYEQKLGASAFSIQLEGALDYTYLSNRSYYALEGALEPRYYYNLRRRIAEGKTANNLSANYVTLRLSRLTVFNGETDTSESNLFVTPAWGFQRRIFRHGIVGYQVGPMLGSDFRIRSEFMAGLVF